MLRKIQKIYEDFDKEFLSKGEHIVSNSKDNNFNSRYKGGRDLENPEFNFKGER